MAIDTEELRPRLGSLLLRRGLLSPEQLEEALEEGATGGTRLGKVLVARGWVTEGEIAGVMAEQAGLEVVRLTEDDFDLAAIGLLPERSARGLAAIPVNFADDRTIVIAVSDPTNVLTIDALRMAIGLNVRLVVAAVGEIDAAIERFYPKHAELAEPMSIALLERGARQDEKIEPTGPAIARVNDLIRKAVSMRASDMHLEPQRHDLRVRARVDGVMREVDTIPRDMQAAVVSRIKVMAGLDITERRIPQDGRVSIEFGGQHIDLRVAVMPTSHGEQVVMRILFVDQDGGVDLIELGMAVDTRKTFLHAISQPAGFVVTCGPTGSGKTTTLYAGLAHLNDDARAVMTIEDPVERHLDKIVQIETNPRAGLTFARGLRTLLRSDPDVLLVGEIRDEETAKIAVHASLTGHMVLSTLHAYDTIGAIVRLHEMGIDRGSLAAGLTCVIAQRLPRRLCPHCAEPYEHDAELFVRSGFRSPSHRETYPLRRPAGCAECGGTGFHGRVALYEVLPVRGAVRDAIGSTSAALLEAAAATGMRTLRQDGLRLCIEGLTSVEEVARVTRSWEEAGEEDF
jgi:type IV pilus assembly protein PilB